MPVPTVPGSVPVAFDDARADEAVRTLEVLAHATSAAAPRWAEAVQAARRDWHGFTRRWFEAEQDPLLHELGDLVALARRTAAAIEEAKVDARRLQARRDHEATLAAAADLRRLGELALPAPHRLPGPS